MFYTNSVLSSSICQHQDIYQINYMKDSIYINHQKCKKYILYTHKHIMITNEVSKYINLMASYRHTKIKCILLKRATQKISLNAFVRSKLSFCH